MAASGFRQGSGAWLATWWLLLAIGYAALARVSMLFADPATHVGLLWLPSGLALAALLRFGLRLWPGVALGAMGEALLRHAAPPPGVAFAVAATLEALLAAWLVRRLIDHTVVLQHIGDVLRFILASVLAPLPAALIAGAVMAAGHAGMVSEADLASRWWLGDLAGILIFAPFALGWSERAYAQREGRGAELALFVVLITVASAVVFSGSLPTGSLVFSLLGFFLWAALRLEVRGMSVPEARNLLAFSTRDAARDVGRLVDSAAANAEANHDLIADDLVITTIAVDEGPTLKRWRARARGRAGQAPDAEEGDDGGESGEKRRHATTLEHPEPRAGHPQAKLGQRNAGRVLTTDRG